MYVESPRNKDHKRLKCGEGAKNCRAVGINVGTMASLPEKESVKYKTRSIRVPYFKCKLLWFERNSNCVVHLRVTDEKRDNNLSCHDSALESYILPDVLVYAA
jgi:hypothetical protein